MGDSIWGKLHLEGREILHHQGRQVAILAERKEVLLMQRIDVRFRVLIDNTRRNDDGPALIGRADAIYGEASRKTSD